MPKLTIWKIECTDDSDCYSIRARTKKAALAKYHELDQPESFGSEVIKEVYQYPDAFDLVDSFLSEMGGCDNLIEERSYKIR